MSVIYRLSTYTFFIGVSVLFVALFTGHLVTVKSVASASPGSGASGASITTSDWQAIRAQYDPTYMDRVLASGASETAASKTMSDWHSTREQYQPGYLAEINKKPEKKTSYGGCGRDSR